MSKLSLKDVMTADPVTTTSEATLQDAMDLMTEQDCRHLPVLKDGKVDGVLSDRDIHLATALLRKGLNEVSVAAAYTQFPYRAKADDLVQKVLLDIAELAIGSVLIVDDDEQLLGIFTLHDACREFSRVLDDSGSE